MAPKEPKEPEQHLVAQKLKTQSQSQSRNQVQAKAKRGSVLSAIEDIQRLTPDAIVQEFDRMVEHTQRHFNEETHMPCTKVANQLMRCLRQHYQESYMCFDVMEEYRTCVGLATQSWVDRLAEEEQMRKNPQLLPVMPPQSTPAPGAEPIVVVNQEVRSSGRSWYRPWTWMR